MPLRLKYWTAAPQAAKHLGSLYAYISRSDLPPALVLLVYLRVSQVNGCAYCVDLHYREATAAGEDPRRLNAVAAWREAPFFSDRERAALAWAEAVTRLPDAAPSDESYARLRTHFEEKELADLTYAIALMNTYNRLAVSFGRGPEGEA